MAKDRFLKLASLSQGFNGADVPVDVRFGGAKAQRGQPRAQYLPQEEPAATALVDGPRPGAPMPPSAAQRAMLKRTQVRGLGSTEARARREEAAAAPALREAEQAAAHERQLELTRAERVEPVLAEGQVAGATTLLQEGAETGRQQQQIEADAANLKMQIDASAVSDDTKQKTETLVAEIQARTESGTAGTLAKSRQFQTIVGGMSDFASTLGQLGEAAVAVSETNPELANDLNASAVRLERRLSVFSDTALEMLEEQPAEGTTAAEGGQVPNDADNTGVPDTDAQSEGALVWLREQKARQNLSLEQQNEIKNVADKLKEKYPHVKV